MDPIEKLQAIVEILNDPFSKPKYSHLTDREKEAARLAAYGFKLREVGGLMGINVSTAGDYLSKIKKKTGLDKSDLTKTFINMIVEVLKS